MNIVIAGGGTAGWLTALYISKVKPEHNLTIIESTKIGIIGAGEGSTGLLTDVVQNRLWQFDCNYEEFVKDTQSSLKYGIYHRDWTAPGINYFGPLDGSPTAKMLPDGSFHYQNTLDEPNHVLSRLGKFAEQRKSCYNSSKQLGTESNHALHFDAHKVGQYFKKVVTRDTNIKVIDDEILDCNLDQNGFIKSLILKNNTVQGDFFIDCTGFSRVLTKKIGIKWKSYKKHLPVNTAMPFIVKYKKNETPDPYTTAWAQKNGWMWQIPTLERKGCGYVFSDEFTTIDQAKKEIEACLGHEIDPIKVFNFDSGRLEHAWQKNCLAIGLSSAFAEPLEATSIHSTIVQLNNFVLEFLKPDLKDTVYEPSIKKYCQRTRRLYDDFLDFLVVHYNTGRKDSDFWRYCNSGETHTEFVKNIIELCKVKSPTFNDFNDYWGAAGWHIWSWVLAGTGTLSSDVSLKELDFTMPKKGKYLGVISSDIENYKKHLQYQVDNLPSLSEYYNLIK